MESLRDPVGTIIAEEPTLDDYSRKPSEQLCTMLDLLPDPVVIVDGKGKILMINNKVRQITGFLENELLERNFLRTKIVTNKSKALLLKNLAKRMIGFHIEPYEIIVLTKSDEKLPFEVNATKIVFKGKPADLVVFRDITARRRAEKALQESEKKYRTLVEQSLQGIAIVKGSPLRVVFANSAVAKIVGYSLGELVSFPSETIQTIIHPEDREVLLMRLKDRLEGKSTLSRYEARLIRKDGKTVWLELSASLVNYEGERAIQATFMDITSRKQAEIMLKTHAKQLEDKVKERTKGLKESEEKLRSIFAASPDAITVTNLDGVVIECNMQTLRMHEYSSKADLIGKSAFELIAECDKQRALENMRKTLEQGLIANIEYTFVTCNGREFPAELSASVIRDALGSAIFFVALTRDITERKRMEKKLLTSERLAAIGELATMVGHDLRNPLQSIQNATYCIENELKSFPTPLNTRNMLKILKDSIDYADKIIKDLRDFSTPQEPIFQRLDLNEIIRSTASRFETSSNTKISLELGKIPKSFMDQNQIQRILSNIIQNSMQAMETGGTITISTKQSGCFIEIEIEDTGKGIPQENLRKIFTPFFTTKSRGMGFGLPICKKFVENHNGKITVSSQEGKGTIFRIQLPIEQKVAKGV